MPDFIQITTTTSTHQEADRIATALVQRRLAACVQIVGPIQSIYRWQDKIERSKEWLCVIKTKAVNSLAIEAAIREHHSYDCPEIIATPITAGSDSYLKWLGEQL